jgi:uncharacterized repeat protein (TIGR03803 family)
MKKNLFFSSLSFLLLCTATFAQSQFTVLHNFGPTPDGSPGWYSSLVSDGTYLYGVTERGGLSTNCTSGCGTIYKIKLDGSGYTQLWSFDTVSNGANPVGSLLCIGTVLYGTTTNGGINGGGIMFKINTDGTGFQKLYDFNYATGSLPYGLLAYNGYLYGMTAYGGAHGVGTIFKVQYNGTGYVVLHSFDFLEGENPKGSLITDGLYLYGMTLQGAVNGMGSIFKIKTDGTGFIKLLDFSGSNGNWPFGSLIYDGTFLYGMTYLGGINNVGAVFKIKPDGSNYIKLHDFAVTNDGGKPAGSLLAIGTYLYGFTGQGGYNNCGTIFKIKPDGTNDTTLLSFCPSTNAGQPYCTPISDGNYLYGIALGGTYGKGVVFRYALEPCRASGSVLSNVSCRGGNNGSATVVSTIGTAPFTYLWSPSGQTGQTATGLSAGTYTCSVTDSTNCITTTTVFISQPSTLVVSASTLQNVSCNGGNDGRARLNAGGGTFPYTYLWTPTAQMVLTATNLTAGTYTVTVTDSHGCSSTSTATITQPLQITLNLSSTNASCATCSNGSASVTPAGGISPYTYSWSNGATTATVSNLLPGNYSCCVTDANGCSTCSGVTVNYNCIAPTIQAKNITFSNVTSNSMRVSWTNGNGAHRIVKIKIANTFTNPVNGTDYSANTVYAGSEQVVYNGTGNTVTVTGLSANTTYWFRVYEANCTGGSTSYLTFSATNNPNKKKTNGAHRPAMENEDNISQQQEIVIYPNPSSDVFTISVDAKSISLPCLLQVFDLTGKVLLQANLSQQSTGIKNELSAGIYFVKVNDGEKVITQKLVIE